MNAKHIRLVGLTSLLLCTACGETDGPAAGEQFSPYNRLVRDYKQLVTITYVGDEVRVEGPVSDRVQLTRDVAHPARLTVSSTASGIAYFVSGKSTDGQLRIESSRPYALYLNGLVLTSTDGPAIDSRCAENTYVVLCDKSTNTLSDANNYTLQSATSDADAQSAACFYVGGRLIFDGTGSLTVNSSATARYEAALGDTLRVHGIMALRGVETPYAVTVNVTATGGDGIYAADSTVQLGAAAYTVTAARYGICCRSGNVSLDGGTLYGSASGGSFVSTPSDCGLAVASGTCFAASAGQSTLCAAIDEDEIFEAQTGWQQRIDSLSLTPDTTCTLTAYVEGANVAKMSVCPVAPLLAPYVLLSVASLTSWSEVEIRN